MNNIFLVATFEPSDQASYEKSYKIVGNKALTYWLFPRQISDNDKYGIEGHLR